MPLKRGRLRESCGFCHRRKVRCDRSERKAAGKSCCSACSLRGQPCKLNQDQAEQRAQPSLRFADIRNSLPNVPAPTALHSSTQDPSPLGQQCEHSPRSTTEASGTPPEDSLHELADYNLHSDAALEDPFFLSMPGAAFLDDVFLGDGCGTQWQDYTHSCTENASLAQVEHVAETSGTQESLVAAEMQATPSYNNSPMARTYAHSIEAAICAYFKYVAPVLPVVPEEAFWIDYQRGLCCESLPLALACRGYPFLAIDNKWHVQQIIARDFRQSFLQRRSESPQSPAVRVDELEGLALMIGFVYEESYQDPAETRFGRLFLSSDSLVLYTLQLEHALEVEESPNPTTQLASLRERYTMLFWHVFGLDAFNCLEQLQPSRIQDTYIETAPKLPATTATGYLDAILSLSLEARAIAKTLRSDRAGHAVMTQTSLSEMYRRLQIWREHLGMGQLAWTQEENPNAVAPEIGGQLVEVRRFALAMLELNCYMQIEHHALRNSQRDISDKSGLELEIMACRIELESLTAIHRAFQNAHWDKIIADIKLEGASTPSPVDCYPHILRNICAGVCRWLQARQDTYRHATGAHFNGVPASHVWLHICATEPRRYRRICEDLRIAVASAASHHDTSHILATLSSGSDTPTEYNTPTRL